MQYHILSINTPSYIPVMRYIVRYLSRTNDIHITETRLKNSYTFPPTVQINPIAHFEAAQDFNRQSWRDKLKKYRAITKTAWRILRTRRASVIYTIDYQVLAIALSMNQILRNRQVKFIYHQFEMVDRDVLQGQNIWFWRVFGRFSRYVNLAILPEENRLAYLLSVTDIRPHNTVLMANTCEVADKSPGIVHPALKHIPDDATLIGHVGNIGDDHYASSFFEAVDLLTSDPTKYLVMVGTHSGIIRKYIDTVKNPRFIHIDTVPHTELPQILNRIDLGLVLYKGVNRNFENCAPNKLYEYWSYGIPVIAHPLAGLTPIFTQPFMGSLIDLSKSETLARHLCSASRLTLESSQKLRHYFAEHLDIDAALVELQRAIRTHCDDAQEPYLTYCRDSSRAH